MKLTGTKARIYLFSGLACLLLIGSCPGGAWCSGANGDVALHHAGHDESCDFRQVGPEGLSCFEHSMGEHAAHEYCQGCAVLPIHFGCRRGLVLPNQKGGVTTTALMTGLVAVLHEAGLVRDALPSPAPDIANATLGILGTIILLT